MAKRSDSEISLESIGFGSSIRPPNVDFSNLPKPVEFSITKLEPEGGSPSGEYVYNCIAFIIYCEKHQRIALSFNERSKAIWLPFIASPQNKTWNDATMDGISIIFSKEDSELDARLTTVIPVKSINCLHVLRIQLPITQKFIYRLIQLITLGNNTSNFKCCQNTKRIQWITLQEAIAGNIPSLWGPEIPIFASFIIDLKQQEIFEYGLDQAYFYVPHAGSGNPEEEMLLHQGITIREVEKIYSDFLEHCFPSFFMTFASFCSYVNDYFRGYETHELAINLFQAFNYSKNGYLSFHEFLLGIISMEPTCPNNEARLKFVFRYYDHNQDGMINEDEFQMLLNDLHSNLTINDFRVFLDEHQGKHSWAVFSGLIVSDNLRGCEMLCRAPEPILTKIYQNFLKRNETRVSASKRNIQLAKQGSKNKGICLSCRDKKYEFGSHCVRLDPNGRCVEPRHILDYEDVEEDGVKTEDISIYKYSQDYVFSTVSIGHTFLDMIRDFNSNKGTAKSPKGFMAGAEFRDVFISYLNILCQNVRSLMECEEKLIKINSPSFVVGDIRGNLEDLILMEKILWQSVPVVANNLIFLGNYINYGKWSIECVLYIFALKIIAPNKFFLIRGNNEIRSSQKNLFYQECLNKYGNKHGQVVWNSVNDVFDRMCLAMIIDESVLCVNSGVPSASMSVDDIYNINSDLKDPNADAIAKDLMTNNRCSEELILKYLDKNNLSHLIRANQFLQDGFQFSAHGKCINVFSTSHYNGKNNESAVICVDNPKIRVVKLDTSKCQSSTDP